MHIILKCVLDYEVPYSDSFQYLTCQVNDIVICDSFIYLRGEAYGFGKNYKTNFYGLFLINKFVIIDYTNYVDKELFYLVSKHQASISNNDKKMTPGISHRVTKKSVSTLASCFICGEHLMGLRQDYVHCILCNQVFHNLCYENHKIFKTCHRILKSSNQSCVASLQAEDLLLTDWSKEQLILWVCSVKLFRIIDFFEMKDITTKNIMDNFPTDENEITDIQNNKSFWSLIHDTFYRQSLYQALVTLIEPHNTECCKSDNLSAANFTQTPFECINEEDIFERHCVELNGHKFRETSYTCKVYCFYCNQILLGLQKQGFHCVKCRNNYHKTCSLQVNNPQCTKIEDSSDFDEYNSSVFGVTLKEQTLDSNGVPLFLTTCIIELEKRFESNCGANRSFECYNQTVTTEDIIYLKQMFSHPKYNNDFNLIGLSEITDCQIAKLIKLFLKELPEPLLTYGLYHSLIECVKIEYNDKISSSQIYSIIMSLPTCNKETLQYLMKHFEVICSKITDNSNKLKLISKKWSYIFSKTLIWPPQTMVNMFPTLKVKHRRIIQLMFEHKLLLIDRKCSTSTVNFPYNAENSMSLSQSLDKNQLQNLKTDMDLMSSDITSQDWYWSDTTKEEVNEYMAGLQDGFFMVRDSSDKTLGVYTLTVRKDGENKLIRIIFRDGRYGFQEPCQFESVPHLVRYYQSNKLVEYNDQLNLTLKYPCSKIKSDVEGHGNDWDRLDNEELINSLSKTMKEYSEVNMRVDQDTEKFESYQKELDEVTKCLKGIDRIQKWCTNHTVHIMNSIQSNPRIKDHSQKCLAQLNKKLKECDQLMKNMNERRDFLSTESDKLQNFLSLDRPNLKKLNRNQSQFMRLLKDRGVPDQLFSSESIDNIDKLCENIRGALNKNNPINIKSNWFIEKLSREEAREKLAGKPPGTFLIRKASDGKNFALDIMTECTIQHCRIFQQGGRYGFIENDCLYQSLEDLVKTFNMRSLEQYNSALKIRLLYPIYYSQT